MQRDNESIIQIKEVDDIAMSASAAVTTLGTAIDTQGMRTLTFGIEPSRAIDADTAVDDFLFTIWECDTTGGTYTQITDLGILPTNDIVRQLVDADADDFLVDFGAYSNKQFVKPAVESVLATSAAATFNVTPVVTHEAHPQDEDGIIAGTP
jgi:hypothetical protein